MNWYDLHRMRLNFRFENPDKCRAIHSELFMYIVDLWNRLGQKEKFWLPTEMTMHFLWIWSYNTYNKAYTDLVEWWFIKEIKKSINQHSARIVAISKSDKAINKALDKATIKASDETTDIIDNNITTNNITSSAPIGASVLKRFIPPTLEHVEEYCNARNNSIEPEAFLAHYDAVGWVYGKDRKPVRDWKACVRTREQKRKEEQKAKEPQTMDQRVLLYEKMWHVPFRTKYWSEKATEVKIYSL